jgi:hypothetical protein
VSAEDVAVVAEHACPYETFRSLARASQLDDEERIRSDSATRIDNPWGWSSYALHEAVSHRRVGPLLRVLAEPVLAEHDTPRALDVYQGVDRETRRIGWPRMRRHGRAVAVRPRAEGGFLVLFHRPAETGPSATDPMPRWAAVQATAVHVAVGHSALSAPDFERSGDARFFHSSQPHQELFDLLNAELHSTVLVRGSGITAFQEIERLLTERERRGWSIRILQLVHPRIPARSLSPTTRSPRRADPSAVRPPGGSRRAPGLVAPL